MKVIHHHRTSLGRAFQFEDSSWFNAENYSWEPATQEYRDKLKEIYAQFPEQEVKCQTCDWKIHVRFSEDWSSWICPQCEMDVSIIEMLKTAGSL